MLYFNMFVELFKDKHEINLLISKIFLHVVGFITKDYASISLI